MPESESQLYYSVILGKLLNLSVLQLITSSVKWE